ncbi:MAG: septal ring lytic transglycosylase RlpA family protein [Myxococcales bacterium]|nr:septal ring lytic transglycosylase RlpA family protein [Myxococcales bacterium]
MLALLLLLGLIVGGCAAGRTARPGNFPRSAEVGDAVTGKASYYGKRFHGRKTASGERFDMHAMTAAHRTLRFGTRVRVTHVGNGRSVVVRINDRGPFGNGSRIIDLSQAAADALGMIAQGIATVTLEVVAAPR